MEAYLNWQNFFAFLMLVNLAGWWIAIRQNSKLRTMIAIQEELVNDALELARRALADRNRIIEKYEKDAA